LLLNEVQKLNVDIDQATKIAESLDTTDGDPLKDFDLSGFMEHFRLNPIAKIALAVSCRSVSKPDIRAKGTFHFHDMHPKSLTHTPSQPTPFSPITSTPSSQHFPTISISKNLSHPTTSLHFSIA